MALSDKEYYQLVSIFLTEEVCADFFSPLLSQLTLFAFFPFKLS